MTTRLSILIEANAESAKRGLAETKAAAAQTSAAVNGIGTKSTSAAGGLKTLAAAETRVAATTVKLGRANKVAAGQMGNLTAQFNDIGIMMAAGQNPLQLALQQGTQITQVIGPMGAAGAVRALGGAFMSLLSPINFITIGAIAAGAAMLQWLRSGTDEVVSLEDALTGLTGAVDDYRKALGRARTPMAEIRREFGDQAAEISAVYRVLSDLARLDATAGIGKARNTITKNLDDVIGRLGQINFMLANPDLAPADSSAVKQLLANFRKDLGLTVDQAREVNAALDEITAAKGPQATADAFKHIREAIMGAANAAGQLPEPLRAAAIAAGEGELEARRFAAAIAGTKTNVDDLWAAFAAGTISGQELLVALQASAGEAATLRDGILGISFDGALEGANTLLARLGDAVSRAAQVAAITGQAGQRGLSENEKIYLQEIEIKNRVNGASEADIAGMLAAERERYKLAETGVPQTVVDVLVADARKRGEQIAVNNALLGDLRKTDTPPAGGGGAATDKSRAALAALITSEQDQLAILRETDPVQKEMLRNREALAGATDAERAAVEMLIATRLDEQQALADVLQTQQFFENTAFNALDGLIVQGQSFADVMQNVAQQIASAALQAVLLGNGPLASLFGVGASGILGTITEAIIPAKAGGGMVYGPGSGTSDSVLMTSPDGTLLYGSSGEFMVNARATAHNRHLLELINAGAVIPGFAAGGIVAPPPPLMSAPANVDFAPARFGAGGQPGAPAINNFYITTPDAKSFENSRVSVARAAQSLLTQAQRYS